MYLLSVPFNPAGIIYRSLYIHRCLLYLLSVDQELVFPSFSRVQLSEKDSFSPTSWIQTSFSDPCMFHAVLLAASSHLDVIRREQGNPITYYHQENTVRLLLDNISECGKMPDTSIAATMYLWYYEVSKLLWSSTRVVIMTNGVKEYEMPY